MIKCCENSVYEAINICKPGVTFSKIGEKITEVAHKEGFHVDEYFCGHGISKHLHMKPLIQHCINNNSLLMEEGMVFTIEPVIMLYDTKNYVVWPDGLTIQNRENPSAQFEH